MRVRVCVCARARVYQSDHGQLHEANILNVRPDMKEGVFVWQYMLHYKVTCMHTHTHTHTHAYKDRAD